MNKIRITVLAVCMLLVSFAVFAGDGIWVGPTALYNAPMTFNELIDKIDTIKPDPKDFTLGAEARIDFGILQASVNGIYLPKTIIDVYDQYGNIVIEALDIGPSIEASANVGLYADLGLVGLGLGAGPKYLIVINDKGHHEDVEAYRWGYNVKAEADIILGETVFSAYFMGYTKDIKKFIDNPDLGNMTGRAGVSVLFQL